MPHILARAVLLALPPLAPLALAADAEKTGVIYADDVDRWNVAAFAGAAGAGVPQGPSREVGIPTSSQIAFLPNGDMCLAGGGVVVTIVSNQTVRLLAGVPGLPGAQDGPVADALLGLQLSVCPDTKGGLFIGDRSNRCVRRLFPRDGQWFVQTIAGDPAKPEWPKGKRPPPDGVGKDAIFRYLHSNVVADNDGNAYIMDENYLRKITPDGRVETLNAGGGVGKPQPGPLAKARFNLIMDGGLAWDGKQNIYVADRWNFCVQKVNIQEKTAEVVAGPNTGYNDGPAEKAGFHGGATHIAYDPFRHRVYPTGADDWGLRALANGQIRTIAGGGKGKGRGGFEGPAKSAELHWCGVKGVNPHPPHDIYFHSGGDVWKGILGRLHQDPAPATDATTPEQGNTP